MNIPNEVHFLVNLLALVRIKIKINRINTKRRSPRNIKYLHDRAYSLLLYRGINPVPSELIIFMLLIDVYIRCSVKPSTKCAPGKTHNGLFLFDQLYIVCEHVN